MGEGQRRDAGGIVRLTVALDEYPAAFAYDWRHRFGLPASVIGSSMDWDEANHLTRELLKEPTSHVAAAINRWPYPWPVEAFILADLFDSYAAVHSKRRPKPRPRPNDKPREGVALRPTVSQEVVRAALARQGHLRPIKGT